MSSAVMTNSDAGASARGRGGGEGRDLRPRPGPRGCSVSRGSCVLANVRLARRRQDEVRLLTGHGLRLTWPGHRANRAQGHEYATAVRGCRRQAGWAERGFEPRRVSPSNDFPVMPIQPARAFVSMQGGNAPQHPPGPPRRSRRMNPARCFECRGSCSTPDPPKPPTRPRRLNPALAARTQARRRREGFEPRRSFPSHDFQLCRFSHALACLYAGGNTPQHPPDPPCRSRGVNPALAARTSGGMARRERVRTLGGVSPHMIPSCRFSQALASLRR